MKNNLELQTLKIKDHGYFFFFLPTLSVLLKSNHFK